MPMLQYKGMEKDCLLMVLQSGLFERGVTEAWATYRCTIMAIVWFLFLQHLLSVQQSIICKIVLLLSAWLWIEAALILTCKREVWKLPWSSSLRLTSHLSISLRGAPCSYEGKNVEFVSYSIATCTWLLLQFYSLSFDVQKRSPCIWSCSYYFAALICFWFFLEVRRVNRWVVTVDGSRH